MVKLSEFKAPDKLVERVAEVAADSDNLIPVWDAVEKLVEGYRGDPEGLQAACYSYVCAGRYAAQLKVERDALQARIDGMEDDAHERETRS